MLINDGISRIPHFTYHPEMLPHIGHNGILFVGECSHFKDDFFADKSDAFINWYNQPLPKSFDGLSDSQWRLYISNYGIRQTIMRNYDKYAKPEPPIPFDELSKFLSGIIEKSYDKYLNYTHMYSRITFRGMEDMHKGTASLILKDELSADSRARWRDCSYCVYYQRPNLVSGEFKEIMPNEDKFAFDVFQQTIDYISPYLIIVLSVKASESIKSQAGGNLSDNIHFFDSEFPSTWSEPKRKEFTSAVDDIAYRWSKYYKRMWFDVTGANDEYFSFIINEALIGRGWRSEARPLEALDDIISTNAESLLKYNPYNIKNAKAIKKDNFHKLFANNKNLTELPWFNSYPINIDTDKIFPLFLATCQGNEDLETVLSKVEEQCQKIVEKYPVDMLIKRNIVLLTDKWNAEIFNNFKSRFQYYERNNYIYFIFAHITESDIDVKYISNAEPEREIIPYEDTLTNVKAKFWHRFDNLMHTFKLGTYTQEQFKPSRQKQRILIRKLENKYVDFFFNEYQSDKNELNISVLLGSKDDSIIKKLISYWKNNDSKIHELKSQYKSCKFVRVLQLSSKDKIYHFDLEHFDDLKDYLETAKAKKVTNLTKNESRDYLMQQGVDEKDWKITQFMSGKADVWNISECLKIELPPLDMKSFCDKDITSADENLKNLLKQQIDIVKNL